jgi:hypothetical protein
MLSEMQAALLFLAVATVRMGTHTRHDCGKSQSHETQLESYILLQLCIAQGAMQQKFTELGVPHTFCNASLGRRIPSSAIVIVAVCNILIWCRSLTTLPVLASDRFDAKRDTNVPTDFCISDGCDLRASQFL